MTGQAGPVPDSLAAHLPHLPLSYSLKKPQPPDLTMWRLRLFDSARPVTERACFVTLLYFAGAAAGASAGADLAACIFLWDFFLLCLAFLTGFFTSLVAVSLLAAADEAGAAGVAGVAGA